MPCCGRLIVENQAEAGTALRISPDQIVILGISPRSGTHFLYHLLSAHPDCFRFEGPIRGNFMAVHLDHLVRFADAVYENFQPHWGVEETVGSRDVLLRCLGEGLTSYLLLQDSKVSVAPASS